MRDQDKSMQETYDFCQEIKHRIQHFVMVDDLFHLKKGGRLSVITFHACAERTVNQIFKKYSEVDEVVKGLPIIPDEYKPLIKLINRKPILPSEKEINENSRSKSAKLRIIERL